MNSQKAIESAVFDHLLAYEADVAGKSGFQPGPNIEGLMSRDRNVDREFDAVLQRLQDDGLITRNADCYYRLTGAGKARAKR